MIEALFVMMNNYLHDLAVAFLFAACVMARVTLRHWPGTPSVRVVQILRRVAWGSLAWIIVGGVIRALNYREYEWLPRAGTAQVPALVAKHVLLGLLTLWGLMGLVRLSRFKGEQDPVAGP